MTAGKCLMQNLGLHVLLFCRTMYNGIFDFLPPKNKKNYYFAFWTFSVSCVVTSVFSFHHCLWRICHALTVWCFTFHFTFIFWFIFFKIHMTYYTTSVRDCCKLTAFIRHSVHVSCNPGDNLFPNYVVHPIFVTRSRVFFSPSKQSEIKALSPVMHVRRLQRRPNN